MKKALRTLDLAQLKCCYIVSRCTQRGWPIANVQRSHAPTVAAAAASSCRSFIAEDFHLRCIPQLDPALKHLYKLK